MGHMVHHNPPISSPACTVSLQKPGSRLDLAGDLGGHFLDLRTVIAFGHHADQRLCSGWPDQESPGAVEVQFRLRYRVSNRLRLRARSCVPYGR